MKKPQKIKALQAESRGLKTHRVGRNIIAVTSASEPGKEYHVRIRYERGVIQARCDCPWGKFGGVACSHVMAALETLAEGKSRRLSFWLNEADAERQNRRTFYLTNRPGTAQDGVWITSRAGRRSLRNAG